MERAMKPYIRVIEEDEGMRIAEDAGAMIQYTNVITSLGPLEGFINPRGSSTFRAPTIYISRQDVERLLNSEIGAK